MIKKFPNGFTLIEILIAITIFSVVALSLYSTFFSAIAVWRRSEALNRVYQEARWSLEVIANELHNAIVLDYTDRYPDFTAFEGSSDKISFLSLSDSGIKQISYLLENENSEYSLKRQETAFTDALQNYSKEQLIETFTNLACEGGLKFSYAYSAVDSEDDVVWQDNWQDDQNLPKGIKIELALRNPSSPDAKITFNKTIFIPCGIIFDSGTEE
jgi:prepilin-type N-terminal cleavage/methylation domain-containing protein